MNLAKSSLFAASFALIAGLASCSKGAEEKQLTKSGLDPEAFVAEINGKPTALYTLTNDNGMEVCVTNLGGRVVSIMVPDRDGNFQDVVLGLDSVAKYADYENYSSDFGAAIGRYANRIHLGQMVVDGKEVQLPRNNVDNPAYAADPENEQPFLHCLHGGPTGWQYQVYDVKEVNDSSITLVMNSPDGDNDFPGAVVAEVTYTLTPDNALDIAYKATTDAPTVINMTNHSYFNLHGDPTKPVTDCVLMVAADEFTPVDETLIPTGEMAAVAGTPFDFTTAHAIGDSIAADNIQIKYGNGYDHNWVLNTNGDINAEAAVLYSPVSGITMTMYTDEPGVQVYTGNFLDGSRVGKHGIPYNFRTGICLETQHYPDSPNHPEWPSVVLNPGETYTSHCIYKFGVAEAE